MANAALRLVFSLNVGQGSEKYGKTGKMQTEIKRGLEKWSNIVVNQVMFETSDLVYKDIIGRIQKQIIADAGREIQNVASQFSRSVIGVGGRMRGPRGSLTFHAQRSQGYTGPVNLGMPAGVRWAQRSDKYLRWKQKEFGHRDWYLNTGALREYMRHGAAWQDAFGTVEVRVTRNKTGVGKTTLDTGVGFGTAGSTKKFVRRMQVATIKVKAMRNVTTAMLPALINGNVSNYAHDNRGQGGLLSLLDPIAAMRLGGRQKEYRHTVEPFLGFLLTRAIPNAVFKRIEAGLGTNIRATAGRKAGNG